MYPNSLIFIINFTSVKELYYIFQTKTSEHKKITDNYLSATLAPRAGLEPATYRLRTTLIFINTI